MKKLLLLPVFIFILAGCNNDNDVEEKSTNGNEVGFQISGDNIEEAEDIPEDEKEKVIAAFQEYIAAFNAEDIDRYKETLSRKPEGFNYEEDLQEVKMTFENYDVTKTPKNITIVRYSNNEAQVYANIETRLTETASDIQRIYSGRQVTVFVKENDKWKVSSIFYIGDQTSE